MYLPWTLESGDGLRGSKTVKDSSFLQLFLSFAEMPDFIVMLVFVIIRFGVLLLGMPRSIDKTATEYSCVLMVEKTESKTPLLECIYCKLQFRGTATRIRAHITGRRVQLFVRVLIMINDRQVNI